MKVREIVREIRRDRLRGATALAERALDALSRSREAAPALVAARPGMPLIAAVVRRALRKGVGAVRREMRSAQAALLRRARKILPAGARYAVSGGSGTVEAILRALKAVRVEGPPADVALVGADSFHEGGDFVNARGTADFLRRARRSGAGVFAVAVEIKRVKGDLPVERGFELVPGRLVHAILTERGLRYPPSGTLAGVEPSWLSRGPLDSDSSGACHPHHAR